MEPPAAPLRYKPAQQRRSGGGRRALSHRPGTHAPPRSALLARTRLLAPQVARCHWAAARRRACRARSPLSTGRGQRLPRRERQAAQRRGRFSVRARAAPRAPCEPPTVRP
eukprot:scaffold311880_cov36-Tisochrysis_lutea.AAC.1